jgi:plastocyanin
MSSRHILATATVALCCACGAGVAAAAGPTTTVTLKDISFKKSVIHITHGSTVRWVWKDGDTPHNVTFARRHSATKHHGTYLLRFANPGTFRYHCTLHPGMDGKVIVR